VNDLTLENQDEEGTLSITPESGALAGPKYNEKDALAKTTRVTFSMNETERMRLPPEAVKNAIMVGDEDSIRQSLASQRRIEAIKRREEIINAMADEVQKNGRPINEIERSLINGLSDTDALSEDVSTILEKKFAEKITSLTLEKKKAELALASAENQEEVDKFADRFEFEIGRHELIRTKAEELRKKVEDQSWGGYAVDFAKGLVPLYDTLKTRGVIGDQGNTLFQGENVDEQMHRLFSIGSLPELKAELDKIDELAADNPQLAEQFLQKLLEQTAWDSAVDDFVSILDFTDAAFMVGGLTKGAITGAAKGIAAQGGIKGAGRLAREELGRVARNVQNALRKRTVDPVEVQAALGEPQVDVAAARALQIKSLQDRVVESGAGDATDVAQLVTKSGPSVSDPYAIFDSNNPTRLSNALATRLLEQADQAYQIVMRLFTDVHKVARLDEGKALERAFDLTVDRVKELYPSIRSAVLDTSTKRVVGTDTISNVNRVEVAIGRPGGFFFEDAKNAEVVMRDYYQIPDFRIEKAGDGQFYGVVTKAVDESSSDIKDVTIDAATRAPSNPFGLVFRWLRSADGNLSDAQNSARKTATMSAEEIQRLYTHLAQPVSDLNKKERHRVSRILELNRDWVDPNSNVRGRYFTTINEFDEEFIRTHKQPPNPKEREAYFAAVRLNDIDYMVRNLNLYRNRASMGWEDWEFKIGNLDAPKVSGVHLDDLPWDAQDDAKVLVIDRDGNASIKYLHDLQGDEKTTLQNAIKNKGRTVVQVAKPHENALDDTLETLGINRGRDPIQYVVSPRPKRTPLSMEQIPYRAGGHVINDTRFFVKSANVRIDGKGRSTYAGDLTFSGHVTEREAQQFARVLEEGRKLFNQEQAAGKAANRQLLDDYVNGNLPMTPNEFRQYFHKGTLSPDGPILVLPDGKSWSDVADLSAMRIRDTVRSRHALNDSADKAFTAERGDALYRFKRGDAGNPIWQMETARTLNPIDSINRGLREALKSRLYNDYVLRSANEFIEQFGDLLSVSKEQMRRNPVWHLYHPQWRGRAYTAQNVTTKETTTTINVPSRPRTSKYEYTEVYKTPSGKTITKVHEYEDGASIQGGLISNDWTDPDIWDKDWEDLQDAFGFRHWNNSNKRFSPPEWWRDAEDLVRELADRLDVPNVKLWYGTSKNGTTNGMYWDMDRFGVDERRVSTIILSHKMSRDEALRVLTHEFGHAVDYTMLRQADPKVLEAIQKKYRTWYKEHFIKRASELTPASLRPGLGTSTMSLEDMVKKGTVNNAQWVLYAGKFEEWFAEEVSAWLLTRKKPMNVVERFFEGVATKWRELFQFISSGLWPNRKTQTPKFGEAVATFMNGRWREDKVITTRKFETVFETPMGDDITQQRFQAANAMRDAVINLVETPTHIRVAWDTIRNRVLNFAYDKWGADTAQWLDESAFMKTRDPIRFMRSIAFHTKIGLFNPVQFFLNAATLMHAALISPTHALPAFRDASMVFYLRRTPSKEVYNWMKKKSGYRYFDELFKLVKDSGVANVGGTSAYLDDYLDPKMIQTRFGRFLDIGATPFKTAEEMVRINAYAIAHREFRKAEPIAPITDAVRRKIIQRADDLSVNMTRASNAWYNNGILSIPTQFTSYNMRLAEQLLDGAFSGKGKLTRMETARVMAGYAVLYGAPTAAAAGIGIWPLQEHFEEWLVANGHEVDANTFTKALSRGLLNVVVDAAIGDDTNFSERYGPGGLSLLREAMNGEKGAIELLFGASGSISSDIYKTMSPLGSLVANIFRDDNEAFPLDFIDFLDAARNISSVDNATKAYMAHKWGLYFTKNEVQVTEAQGGISALNHALLGLTPRDAIDAFVGKKYLKDTAKYADEVTKLVTRELHRAFRAYQDGDEKQADKFFKRAAVYLRGADLSEEQRRSAFSKALGTYGNDAEDVERKMIQRALTEDVLNRRLENMERKSKGSAN
jgi:hypothetical protein